MPAPAKLLKKGATYDDLCRVPIIDRGQKLRIYTREGVAFAWFVDPLRQSLEVLALETGSVRQLEGHHGSVYIRARPFDAVELELSALWS